MTTGKNIFSTSETAYAVDREGQVVVWNRAAEKTFGYTESEALGHQCWELLSGQDIFGNPSCCEGCPVRVTAFDGKRISRFQIDFKTAKQQRKRFTVSTLMLLNSPGKEVFVHLCHPESEVSEDIIPKHTADHSEVTKQRHTLTLREIEVLTLLHKGMTITEIANSLNICTSTVRNHTQHILLKLHVHSRFEAVAVGRKLNLI
jgi:DNA-binding CsgD family transcriptional regulator